MTHPTHNAGDTVLLWCGTWSMSVVPYTVEKVTAKGYTLSNGQRVDAEFRNRSADIHGLANEWQLVEHYRSTKARRCISGLKALSARAAKMTAEQLDTLEALIAQMEDA